MTDPRRWRCAIVPFAFAASAACGQSSPTGDPAASSDSTLQQLADARIQDVRERSGLPFARPVRVEWRSEEELIRYLVFKLEEEELAGGRMEWIRDSYALLGLLPRDLDLEALFLELYTEQVAGFYDPDSLALFVRSGQSEDGVEAILVHELVHAAQDQVVDLDALIERDRGNDRQAAARAAVEGHATFVMLEYTLEQQGASVDLLQMPGFGELMGSMRTATTSSSPALAAAPRIVRESLIFPYVEGTEYIHALWRRHDGRPAPFGELLPVSTEQILDPERAFGPEPDPPVEIEIGGGDGAQVTYTNSLGLAEIRILLEEVAGVGADVRGWGGDEFALVESAEGQGLVWWSVWDDEAARDAFLVHGRALVAALTDATLEAGALDGLPVVVLTVGVVPVAPSARILEGT